MTTPQQGFGNFQQPAPAAQFQSPQYTQPYNAPAQQFVQPQPGPQAPPAAQGPAPAQGSLGKGWDQGSRAGGHGTAVKFPVQGSVFAGFVAREMVDSDCRQAREPSKDGNGPLKFFKKSGQVQYEYMIPFNVQPSADYPEGKATLFTSKYKLHSAVIQAMIAQNYKPGEGLHEGDFVEVQRIADVVSGYGQPGHDFVARVTRRENLAQPGGPAVAQQLQQAPAQNQVEYAAPAAAPVQQYSVDPTAGTSAPAPFTANPTAGPAATGSEAPQIPGLDPAQAALVARYAPGAFQQPQQ